MASESPGRNANEAIGGLENLGSEGVDFLTRVKAEFGAASEMTNSELISKLERLVEEALPHSQDCLKERPHVFWTRLISANFVSFARFGFGVRSRYVRSAGDTWVHLRLCLTCGLVGCCDDSKNKHARKHFPSTQHSLIRSIEPGEAWIWCYKIRCNQHRPSQCRCSEDSH
jgi:hypothetical protein